jgi:hypothetical protein
MDDQIYVSSFQRLYTIAIKTNSEIIADWSDTLKPFIDQQTGEEVNKLFCQIDLWIYNEDSPCVCLESPLLINNFDNDSRIDDIISESYSFPEFGDDDPQEMAIKLSECWEDFINDGFLNEEEYFKTWWPEFYIQSPIKKVKPIINYYNPTAPTLRATTTKPTFTYLMLNNRNGYYKIGRSVNPKYREKTLQAEDPDVSLIWKVAKNIEKKLHRTYSEKRIRGEWFSLTHNDVKAITSIS